MQFTSWTLANSIASSLSRECPLGYPVTEVPFRIRIEVSMEMSPTAIHVIISPQLLGITEIESLTS
jgi:hypothetical protein